MISILHLRAGLLFASLAAAWGSPLEPVPAEAKLALDEDWSSGRIDPQRWYVMRRHWGGGNHGVVPENVGIEQEGGAAGHSRAVLVCRARGDQYQGPVRGLGNRADRVGGVIVSKAFFASGRYEVEMRVGTPTPVEGGPANPAEPAGMIPAIWVYAGWNLRVPEAQTDAYVADEPLYQPYLQEWAKGNAFYWSELDFPELGKKGDYRRGLYNTFLHKQSDSRVFDLPITLDGRFHTYTTEWRTTLVELKDVSDRQTLEHRGYWWVRDLRVPFGSYWGNPLKRLGPDRYAVHQGSIARHWIDGKFVGENAKFVPSIAAQLSLGVWLPDWAGPAAWKESQVAFGRVRVWQYHDEGDVRGILTNDQPDNIGPKGELVKTP